jgi:hypothetical protein
MNVKGIQRGLHRAACDGCPLTNTPIERVVQIHVRHLQGRFACQTVQENLERERSASHLFV